MKAQFKFERPEEIEATMTVTMPIREWEKLRDQLAEKWPSSRLCTCITNLLIEAHRTAYEEKDAI
jgi:hypothetical protein